MLWALLSPGPNTPATRPSSSNTRHARRIMGNPSCEKVTCRTAGSDARILAACGAKARGNAGGLATLRRSVGKRSCEASLTGLLVEAPIVGQIELDQQR